MSYRKADAPVDFVLLVVAVMKRQALSYQANQMLKTKHLAYGINT